MPHPSPDQWPSPLLFPGIEPEATVHWTPTLEDVAALTPAYTVEGLLDEDADPDDEGTYLTFTEGTDPSATQVRLMIAKAVKDVAGRVGLERDSDHPDYADDPTGLQKHASLAREAATWHVVMAIEKDKRPGAADDADGPQKAARDQYRALLEDLKDQARRTLPRLT